MLMRTDPFRELDRLTQQAYGGEGGGARPLAIPMDAYREGDSFIVAFDLPGMDVSSIDVAVERNVLTVRAERRAAAGDQAAYQVAERPQGEFSRQLFLGDTLDTEKIEAGYDDGVLTLRIPVSEQAKPRRIPVERAESAQVIDA
ncbi:MAG TPA: Hsp20/alpha crystallin family protein [Pseudonocardia sp.]|jgi:HSP20 family protein|nr:Hsp20/alpha crystallin family protein [Pseudonocardia sp.]